MTNPLRARALIPMAVAVVLALALAGCAGRPESRATGLMDVLRRHHDHVRWQNYAGAGVMVAPAFAPAWKALVTSLGRVTEFELGDIDLKDPPGEDAYVLIRLSGFRVPDLTVHTHVYREHWHRDGDVWHLTEMPELPASPLSM